MPVLLYFKGGEIFVMKLSSLLYKMVSMFLS